MFSLYDPLLLVIIGGLIFLLPFTKVQESFGIQAIHDIIHYGIKDISKYDHLEFPGSVQHSFIGPLIVSLFSAPIVASIPKAASKLDGQLISRGVLGVINAFGIMGIKNALVSQLGKESRQRDANAVASDRKGKKGQSALKKTVKQIPSHEGKYLGLWYALFQFTQIHLNMCSSRTMPNFFALPFTNYAFGKIISGEYTYGLSVFAFTGVVFGNEILALTGLLALVLYLYKRVSLDKLIRSVGTGFLVGAVLSLSVDSYFWGRWTIPELESMIYKNNVAEWGTRPFTSYLLQTLVSIFLPLTVPLLSVLGIWKDISNHKSLQMTSLASLLYMVLVSFQSLKEWRFVAYIIPIINLCAANGASFITEKAHKSHLYKVAVLLILSSSFFSLCISTAWAVMSSYNYPGGFAMNSFHGKVVAKAMASDISTPYTVHIDTAAAMTGVTRFMELTDLSGVHIEYDKTEIPDASMWDHFDYLITEVNLPEDASGSVVPKSSEYRWQLIDVTEAFESIDPKGVRHLNPPALIKDLITKREFQPIGKAVRPFIHLKNALLLYEKVPL